MTDQPRTCPACEGTGKLANWHEGTDDRGRYYQLDLSGATHICPWCDGTGQVVPYREKEVKRP